MMIVSRDSIVHRRLLPAPACTCCAMPSLPAPQPTSVPSHPIARSTPLRRSAMCWPSSHTALCAMRSSALRQDHWQELKLKVGRRRRAARARPRRQWSWSPRSASLADFDTPGWKVRSASLSTPCIGIDSSHDLVLTCHATLDRRRRNRDEPMAAVSVAVELKRAGVSMGGSPPDMWRVRAVAIDVGPCPCCLTRVCTSAARSVEDRFMPTPLLATVGPCSTGARVACAMLLAVGGGL